MRPKKPSGVRKTTPARPRTRPRKPARIARSVRTAKVVRAHRPTSAPIASAPKTEAGPSQTANAWALALGAAGVVAVGLLIGLPADDRASVGIPADLSLPIHPAMANERAETVREPPPQIAARPAKASAAAVTTTTAVPAAQAAPAPVPVVEMTAVGHSTMPAPPVVASRSEPAVEQPALVTITGCLETDDERFRLNDTTGSDAPKSRSWKSGFLRKRPAPIDVLDASGVGLPRHVGERVALTGTLVDRNMHVRSLQRIGASCE